MNSKKFLKNISLVFAASVSSALLAGTSIANQVSLVHQLQAKSVNVPPRTLEELNQANIDDIVALRKYDSRDYDIVTNIDNQRDLPICWSYATAAAAETAILKNKASDLTRDKLDIDELIIDDMTNERTRTDDILGLNSKDTFSFVKRKGNTFTTASRIMSQGRGPIQWYAQQKPVNQYEKIAHLSSMIRFPKLFDTSIQTRNEIKKMLVKYGALAISYNSKGQGVWHNYWNSKGNSGDLHAVTIVGWDDTISKESYASTNGWSEESSFNGGWIVKNSWGIGAGDNGYFYLSYDSPILTIGALEFSPLSAYDYNYYYDGGSGKNNTIPNYNSKKSAAIFPAKKASYDTKEVISSVSFELTVENTDVVAKVYKGVSANPADRMSTENQPESGKLVATMQAHYEYPGYYTISLNEPIEIKHGEFFSVVIETSTNSAVAIQREILSPNDLTFYADADDNNKWKNTWTDSETVARIRAQTSVQTIPDASTSTDLKYANAQLDDTSLNTTYRYRDGLVPNISVSFVNQTLIEGRDYKITHEGGVFNPPAESFSDDTFIGYGTIKVSGINNFSGETKVTYPIYIGLKPDLSAFNLHQDGVVQINVESDVTNYNQISLPEGWRFASDGQLTPGMNWNSLVYEGKDQNCYRNNTASVTVYKSGEAPITKKDISNAVVDLKSSNHTYTGSEIQPKVQVTYNNIKLNESVDYSLRYFNNINASADATVTVVGQGDYVGLKQISFKISKAKNNINKFDINNDLINAQATHGKVKFRYYQDSEGLILIPENQQLQPGTYYVQAYVEATDNYEGCKSQIKEFVVFKPTNQQTSNNNSSGNNQNQSSDGLDKPNDSSSTINPVLIAVITIVSIVAVSTIAGLGFWFGRRQKNK